MNWSRYRAQQRLWISDFKVDPVGAVKRISTYFDSSLFDLLNYAELIGKGKQGTVYKYENYAIKVWPYKAKAKAEPLTTFSFIGSIAVRMHPAISEYIITKLVNGVYGLSLKDNMMLMVTDYYDTSLKDYINNRSQSELDDWLLETYNMLVDQQSRGFLIHGDLKIDNIMIKDNKSYLIDFGQSSISVRAGDSIYRIIPDRFNISCNNLVFDNTVTFNYSITSPLWTRYCNIPYYSSFNFVTLVVSILCQFPQLINNNMLQTLMKRVMIYNYKKSSSCGYNDILKLADGVVFLPLLEHVQRIV